VVTLSWSASPGATSYGVAVRDVVTNTLVVDTTTTSTSYTATNLEAGKTYRWNVAALSSAGSSAYTVPLYFQTPSAGLTVTVTAPNGGETWTRGIPQTISWSVTGDTSQIANFFISYSLDGGSTYSNDVGTVLAASRSTSWTPPLAIASGASGRIRLQARTVNNSILSQDVSDGNFSFDSVSTTGMRFDRDVYFAQHEAYFGPPSADQRVALNTLLGFIETDPALPLDATYKHLRWAAYMLATTRHEGAKPVVGPTYMPVEETGYGAGQPYGAEDPITHYQAASTSMPVRL
jgi:hypothetical protein